MNLADVLTSFGIGAVAGAVITWIIYYARRTGIKRDPVEEVAMESLCWAGTTLYGVDNEGRVWYIDMTTGKWALHSNPPEPDANIQKIPATGVQQG